MLDWIVLPGWRDLVDIAVVAGFGWLAIRGFRRTNARNALAGLALLGVVYLVARTLDLRLTATLLQAFLAVVVLVFVVVFQEDLRRVFEQLGTWGRSPEQPDADNGPLDVLVRTVARLASTRVGALIVIPGRELLDRHIEGGIALGGRLSEPLLLSIFDSSSPGHDGALILRGSTIERFAVHLPLSANHAALGPGGTRHAAALGLAERCDAICIVVSEERGTISIARDGEIHVLARPEDLVRELQTTDPEQPAKRRWSQGNILDAALAGTGALLLWTVLIPGSEVEELVTTATIELSNLPKDMVLESVEPSSVDVTVRGLRRDLLLAERDKLSVQIDAYLASLGRRTFAISAQDVRKPDSLSVVTVAPEKVRLSLKSAAPAQESKSK